jgi:peroxisomal 3,2-trans-enoyl-CoA isomerase
VQTLSAPPSNEDKLALYALFKQATVGPNTTSKPGMFDVVGKFKWQAWADLGAMPSAEAERKYIELCTRLGAGAGGGAGAGTKPDAAAKTAGAGAPTSGLQVSTSNGVLTLTLNRPEKRNAITIDMYKAITRTLGEAGADPAVRVVVLTGAGGFYSAGNDLSNFTDNMPPEGPAKLAADGRHVLEAFVNAFITFPKLLIAAVNGPAVGIPVTLLPLADVAYASHKATFHTPFTALGQSPEACSSVTFPRMMGPGRATEMLLLGRKLTAAEARDRNLVADVFEDGEFRARVDAIAAAAAALPPQSMRLSKGLVRGGAAAAELQAVNAREAELLAQRWLSDECMNAIMAFMSKGKK